MLKYQISLGWNAFLFLGNRKKERKKKMKIRPIGRALGAWGSFY
jgi:hypothetical protein